MSSSYQDQVVWIIGASSGIGLALAHELASQGARLALSARRQDALEQLQSTLGVGHQVFALDVTNLDMIRQTAQAIAASYGRVDKVVFMAASYQPMDIEALEATAVDAMIDVNIKGAFHVVQAVLPLLKAQQVRGQLALCGSVAGYMGLPNAQPYSATKAAIINLAESLRVDCRDDVDIKLISPGFVRTPLTDKNNFHMPMMIEPEQAAKAIAEGLLSDRFEIHFPKRFTWGLKFLQMLPYAVSLRLTRSLKRKALSRTI
jgi:NADP-dependent 3-hydroxy acid dehydrogenase YdfG